MKLAVLISSIFLFAFMLVNYQFVLGFVGAQVEAWRLRENAAGKVVLDNPPNAIDSFENGLSDHWETRVINGSGMVDPGPEFSSGKFEVKDGGLLMYLSRDPDFENKPTSKRYNNVALIGFRGYSPAPDRDIVASAIMQAGPGFFGTAGIVFEPVHTLQQDGAFKPSAPFNMFGASIIGPESEIYGNSGAVCSLAVNWWPSASSLGGLNIFEPHAYEIRRCRSEPKSTPGTTATRAASRRKVVTSVDPRKGWPLSRAPPPRTAEKISLRVGS